MGGNSASLGGASGETSSGGASSVALCEGKTLTGSCSWSNGTECADFYGEEEATVMQKCPSSIGVFSQTPCVSTNNVGSCEKHLPEILGSGCEVFWYFSPDYETQEISDGCPEPDAFHAP